MISDELSKTFPFYSGSQDKQVGAQIPIHPGTWRKIEPDLYTTHAKSINSIVAKCENVLIQSP